MKNNFYLVEKIYEEIYSLTNNLNKLLNDFILIIENNENKFYQFN